MDCETAQEQILDSLDERPLAADVAAHAASCQACAAFLAAQTNLDARLSRTLVAPRMSARFRSTLRGRIAAEKKPWLPDALPDIFHFLSWGVATVACAAFLSLDPSLVFVAGAAAALSTYVVLTVVRSTLEDA